MSRRVVQDSDDEAEAISPANSPQQNNIPVEQTMTTLSNTAATSSTDPVLFRDIYNKQHHAAFQESPPNNALLPVFEDPFMNPRMSSSPISVKRLKRSRTMNPSSLTSVTSPHDPQHRAKRTKSLKGIDTLTQLTTPGNDNHEPRSDIWEFTGSSDPKPPEPLKPRKLVKDSAVKEDAAKENATKEKKSYGKLRRSKTMTHTQSSQSDTWNHEQAISKDDNPAGGGNQSSGQTSVELSKSPAARKEKKTYGKLKRSKTLTSIRSSQSEVPEDQKLSSKDDSRGFSRKRASSSQDFDAELSAPKTKKQKHDLQGTHASGEILRDLKGTLDADTDRHSSSVVTIIQVPRTASEQDARPVKPFDLSFGGDSSIITSPRLKLLREHVAPVTDSVEKSTGSTSISIVPATMTDSQKMTYETISVVSTNQERRSSVVEAALEHERHDPSNSPFNEAPEPNRCSWGVDVLAKIPSSSSPVTTANSKIKRAKSLSGIKANRTSSQAPVSSTASAASIIAPKLTRSKTMTSRRTPQSSIDELSYTKSQELENTLKSKTTSKDTRKKAKKQPEERVNPDELFGSDEVGLPRELYQPRPSRRRSKSMSVTPVPDDTFDFTAGLPRPKRRKSIRATREEPESAGGEALAQHGNTLPGTIDNDELVPAKRTTDHSDNKEGQPTTKVTYTWGSQANETILLDTNFMTDSKEIDMPEATNAVEISSIPVAPKRRGRPPNVPATAPVTDKTTKSVTENFELFDDSLETMETPAEPAPKAAPSAKRRGRPPKMTGNVVEATEEVEILSNNKDTLVERVSIDARNVPLKGNFGAIEPDWSKPADFLLPKSTPPQPTEKSTSLPLMTPTKNIKKGPDHSPILSSKVPYRVGLSKRTKIAPLLKMIKK